MPLPRAQHPDRSPSTRLYWAPRGVPRPGRHRSSAPPAPRPPSLLRTPPDLLPSRSLRASLLSLWYLGGCKGVFQSSGFPKFFRRPADPGGRWVGGPRLTRMCALLRPVDVSSLAWPDDDLVPVLRDARVPPLSSGCGCSGRTPVVLREGATARPGSDPANPSAHKSWAGLG